jgi:hypothetical protein
MSSKSIETQLFSWKEWDEILDPGDCIFCEPPPPKVRGF